ncbi:DUF5018 domain-containing protein [uncultured Croceitalea sp.]|uniref:leucine-rich repeat domain-containing protein n=1 Tax=uncultured Croceitalea sp. TaxID=1798908 RepID=UPI003305AC21
MKKIIFFTALLLFGLTSCDDDDQAELNNENQLLTFSFLSKDNDELSADVNGTVDQSTKTVLVELSDKIDVSELKPTITISENATVSPDNQITTDFSEAVTYQVKAEDGATQDYKVTVTLPKSSAKQLLSFVFLASDNEGLSTDVEAVIDEVNKTVSAAVPFGVSLDALVPTLQVSENAEVNPGDKIITDFSSNVSYEVKAEDDGTQTYTAIITNAPLTDRDVLIAWYNLNPNNTLDWDFSKEIDEWEGITVADGRVEQIRIQSKGLSTMTPLIEYLTELNALVLVGNEISSLPAQIAGLKKLRALDLTENLLESLPAEIGNLTSLQSIVLHNNGVITLPTDIGNLENLIQLDLTFNDLNSLPSEVGQLKELQSLSVYGSRQLASVPEEIGNLTKLINLNLGWCNLSSVPSTLGNLTNLTDLRIDENGLQEVPKEIGNLINVKTLQLQKNQISQLPSELGGLSSLLVLYIQENQITTLPQELCDLITTNNVSVDKDSGASCP